MSRNSFSFVLAGFATSLLLSNPMRAEAAEAYCLVLAHDSITSPTGEITVNCGDVALPGWERVDERAAEFSNVIDALNHMADEGWTYVNAYATTNGDSNVHHYMMKRTVPAEEPAVAAEPFTAHGASIELTAPWVDLKLPVGNGEVVLSDDIQLSVVYRGAKQTELHKTYGNAIKARGWEHHVENDVTAAITTQFKKDGRTLVLTVAASVGFTTVSVIILDF